MNIHWASLFSGVAVGLFLAGAGGLEQSKEDHARELVLSQIVAIEHLTSQGTPPSAKAEIDAEVARVEDYVTRIRALEKSGKPWDRDFVGGSTGRTEAEYFPYISSRYLLRITDF